VSQVTPIFNPVPHPRTQARMAGKAPPPPKVDDERVGFNGRLGLFLTTIVGTMWAAYLFALLAFVSFPSAIRTGNSIIIVAWIAQTFLQLILLPIIIVGQNILGKAADKRSEQTYQDVDAILHECEQIQAHLAAQDDAQMKQVAEVRQMLSELMKRGGPP
jgi:hypothetical protein